MKEIIAIESPISKSLLFKKILKLWNTARAGAKLSGYLAEIVETIPNMTKTTVLQDFYWNTSALPQDLKTYRENTVEKRNIDDIAFEEISIAILEITEANISLSKDDLIRLTARSFDFQKVGSQIDSLLNQVIESMLQNNQLIQNGDRLKVVH